MEINSVEYISQERYFVQPKTWGNVLKSYFNSLPKKLFFLNTLILQTLRMLA